MALYDNKFWLLSHIRNSFISTDDTGMCQSVMLGKDLTKYLEDRLDCYSESSDDEDEDDIGHGSPDIQLETESDFVIHRQRSNTTSKLEKIEQARKKAAKVKHVQWEPARVPPTEEDIDDMFVRKTPKKSVPKKSLFSEQMAKYVNLPQNPYIHYSKFDGAQCAQMGEAVRKYKIFLTMLPEDRRNYPMHVCCLASAKIQDLIGLILFKCSTEHGDFPLQPATNYGLYITEEDGEVDSDFPCLEPKEGVAKYGFTCLGLVEHNTKSVCFDNSQISANNESVEESLNKSNNSDTSKTDVSKQISADMQMKVHATAMEAPLHRSYRVYIINKVRAKVEINLGISGDKIEIDPVHPKSSKFALVKQKAVSHNMDSVAWCEITDTKSSRSTFRVVYSMYAGSSSNTDLNISGSGFSPSLHTSASFKHYDFEADHATAEEVVQKINLILELCSSAIRKEYLTSKDRKHYKRKTLHLTK